MHIVIDTTAVYRDKLLTNPRVRIVSTGARAAGGNLHVPEIVLDELAGQCRKELEKAAAMSKEAVIVLRRHAPGQILPGPAIDVAAAHVAYMAARDANLAALAVERERYPQLGARELVTRYYSGKRPYKADGTGFKDHILWGNVVHVASRFEGATTIFVTDNVKDFASKDGSIHPDLIADLIEAGVDPGRVLLRRDLESVVREFIRPEQGAVDPVPAHVRDMFAGVTLDAVAEGIRTGNIDLGMPSGLSNVGLDALSVNEPTDVTMVSFKEGEAVVEGIVVFRSSMRGVAPLLDWEWIADSLLIENSDEDEEGHYVSFMASVEGQARVRMLLKDLAVEAVEAITASS